MNVITIVGRLTADPESRTVTTADGPRTVTTLPLAIPAGGGRDAPPTYIDVVAWGALAETCAAHLTKGRRVGVHGRLDLDRWNAQDGTPRRAHRVVATDVEFLDRPRPLDANEPAA